jgi:hypothetical protein
MQIIRRTFRGAFPVGLVAALAGGALTALLSAGAGASTPPGAVQVPAAQAAAQWLSTQLTPQGYVTDTPNGPADLSATVNTVLALEGANVNLAKAKVALSYLGTNAASYVVESGVDAPGNLALLILAAHALGQDPTTFGGINLVSRLLATEQTTGPNAGLFGTDAQAANFGGTYDQGLALAALHAAGVSANASATSWLLGQQCADGGWPIEDQADNPCNTDPALFGGPDTNTTSAAVQGLEAQGALSQGTPAGALAVKFIEATQDSDGGWGYYPDAADAPETSDPDSTALSMQALLALGVPLNQSSLTQSGGTPTSALLSFRVATGTDTGAFFFPGGSDTTTGSEIATYQAAPALMGLSFPFGPSGHSYWAVSSSGGVFSFGNATFHGSAGGQRLNSPVVGSATIPDGQGYWLAASDGGVFSYGDARFYGSAGGTKLNKPIVGIAATPDGGGYWLVASDGGVFSYGDARFYGSAGGTKLNKPIVGIEATPDGGGYWLVASDGGVFSYGDASFHGSAGALKLNKPIVGIAASPDGGGYWLVASDGGVFSYGDAPFYGSTGSLKLNSPIVGIAASPDGGGYWLVASDGGVFNEGDAVFSGSAAPLGVRNVVGISASSS